MSRLPQQPGERIDRSEVLSFSFDGKLVKAHPGDTIGSALYASGQRTFSRSFKYHRRRGLMCCAGQCPNCLVDVDGAPGIRACTEPVREGIEVSHQNARPGLNFDVMAVTDLLGGPFTPPGFYYKTFMRPRRLWPLYEKVLRHAAGLGVLPKRQNERLWDTEYRRRHCDVLVVGGGLAGLHAAIEAARLGADVVLADEGAAVGGRLLAEGGHEVAGSLASQAAELGVEVLTSAPVLGVFDGLAAIWQKSTLHQVRAQRLIFATGSIEQPLVFEGNDLPGVMLAGGATRLINLYRVKPGERAVVVSASGRALSVVKSLLAAGIEVVDQVDLREGRYIKRAIGRKAVSSVVIAEADGTEKVVACDLLISSGSMSPATSLVLQGGARARYDASQGHFAVEELADGVYVAGDVSGHGEQGAAELSGAIAGRQAALDFDFASGEALQDQAAATHALASLSATGLDPVAVPSVTAACEGKSFVCFCEDVTVKDLGKTVAEGYSSLELAKRYSTVTMGPCQGRMCQLNSARVIGADTGLDLAAVGVTTARPPWSTVPMGALAGKSAEPAKRSALHAKHRALGANVRWAGDWRRAYDYGDPRGETLAVQSSAGIIDVSTLGKFIVRGPDSAELLDRLYPNVMSSVRPGRIRYGVVTSDAGRVMDDGTVCRLDDETFYVTTTSGGASSMEQWFSWWLSVWDLDARITDVTQGVAAINLAGPNAREVLSKLTSLDCSNDSFGYLDAKHAEVAGVPCLLLRIGFVGEVGYEIHCPSAQAQHVWEALMDAGHGQVRPFGLEPQRVLRLQKLHVIIGQDTDSESTPYGAAMPWIVKLDKPQDFIGRWALEYASQGEPQSMLVGFSCPNGEVPAEGSAVIDAQSNPVGQVTSARHSPKLQAAIGMAWVPAVLAQDDTVLTISDAGHRITARVQTAPFYDPEGMVVRS